MFKICKFIEFCTETKFDNFSFCLNYNKYNKTIGKGENKICAILGLDEC